MKELEKPKSQQRLSEDFFIEMEKSLKAVVRRMPEYDGEIDNIRDVLIAKFKKKLIPAVTDFRQLSKIASSMRGASVDQSQIKNALDTVFSGKNSSGIRDVYSETVEFAYEEKKVTRYIDTLSIFVSSVIEDERTSDLDVDLFIAIEKLYALLGKILESVDDQ